MKFEVEVEIDKVVNGIDQLVNGIDQLVKFWDLNFDWQFLNVLKQFNRTCPDLHDTFKIIWTFQQEKIRKNIH